MNSVRKRAVGNPGKGSSSKVNKEKYASSIPDDIALPKQPDTASSPCASSDSGQDIFRSSSRITSLSVLTVLSLITRLYRVDYPDWVCWDETHFGKMASWYINRTFFFDVHPPLGKMSIAFVGYLSGYNGTFAWDKPGDMLHDYPYVGMRIFCAVLGAMLVPLAFETVYALSKSIRAASVAGCCVLFDTGMMTLTRYILLDAPLLFCILATAWACVKSWQHEDEKLTSRWWFWHCCCGFFLACAMCVKFVGIFVVLWVGCSTILRLVFLWSSRKFPLLRWAKQFLCRAFCLIFLPIVFYTMFFAVHLAVLNRSGPGDGFYSSAFQSVLIGNPLNNATMPGQVAYGSLLALKNTKANGAYLHSHVHRYPASGEMEPQQQVTCYSHKDDNNLWLISKVDEDIPTGGVKKVELIKNGDLVRFTHAVTGRNLHAHRLAAPVTRHHYQVSGYGSNGTGDANDFWQISIENGQRDEVLKTMVNHFRLIHVKTKCVMESGTKQLPKWGWEQLEVSCNPRPKKSNADNELWHVEWVHFPLLPNVTFSSHAPSFLSRFIESHKVMIKGNSGLKPKEGEILSKPWQWPLDLKGQFFSAGPTRIYLLGNPILWWMNIAIWIIYVALEVFVAVRRKRKIVNPEELNLLISTHIPACRWMIFGWMMHYVPFYGMGRILYYHHYFPAHLFACMLTGLVIDFGLILISNAMRMAFRRYFVATMFIFFVLIFILSFYLFYPLAYGMDGSFADFPNSTMHGMRWLNTWEF